MTSTFKINPAIISNNPTIRSVILISDKGKGDPVDLKYSVRAIKPVIIPPTKRTKPGIPNAIRGLR